MKNFIPNIVATVAFSCCCLNASSQWVKVAEYLDGGISTKLNGVDFCVISPDGLHLYTTSPGSDNGLSAFAINQTDATLTLVQDLNGGAGRDSELDITPDGQYVYVSDQTGDQADVYSRNAGTGALTLIFQQAVGNMPEVCRVSPDGTHLYVAHGNEIRVYTINANGSLTWVQTMNSGWSCNGGQMRSWNEIKLTSDGSYLYASGDNSSTKSVDVFSRNTTTGVLTWLESHNRSDASCNGPNPHAGMANPYDLAITSDDNYLYVAGGSAGVISRFSINGNGTLNYLGSTTQTGGGTWCYTVAVTPDGSQLFGAYGVNLNIYDINATNGNLTLAETHLDDNVAYMALNNVAGVSFSPTGRYAYTMGHHGDGITVLENPLITLGVSLKGFDGALNNEGNAELNWETLSETDLEHFDVERSFDGVSYENIGTVVATGNSTVRNDYALMDPVKVDEIAYYRLKSVDEDGKYALSNVIILRNKQFCEMKVWLNDQSGKINIDANTCSGVEKETTLSAALYDVNGKAIRNIKTDEGSSTQMDAQALPSGIYFVRVQKGQKVYKQKIIIP